MSNRKRKMHKVDRHQASLPFLAERDALSLVFTQIPLPLRAEWALQAVSVRLAQSARAVDNKELQAMLSSILVQLKFPREYSERVITAAKKVSGRELVLLTAFGEVIMLDAELRPEKQSAIAKVPLPQVSPEERYFSLWTEKGHGYGTESEYREEYAIGSSGREPLVSINRISEEYSVFFDGRRRRISLSEQRRNILCTLLRKFNEPVPNKELNNITPNYAQVLDQLHGVTFNVLRPFIDKEPGEFRIIRTCSMRNRKRKFTFCLIERYEISTSDEQSSKGR